MRKSGHGVQMRLFLLVGVDIRLRLLETPVSLKSTAKIGPEWSRSKSGAGVAYVVLLLIQFVRDGIFTGSETGCSARVGMSLRDL